MKQIIMATVIAAMISTSVGAMSPDSSGDFHLTSPPEPIVEVEPEIVYDWDYFWGTTAHTALDPKLNGWDEFWNKCNIAREQGINGPVDSKLTNCVSTLFVGIIMAAAIPIAVTYIVVEAPSLAIVAAAIGVGAA